MRRWFGLAFVVAWGCGSTPPPRPVAPTPPAPETGALTTLLPQESRFVLLAEPQALLAAPPTERVLRAIFSDEQLDRFAARTGVDLRTLTELAVAAHPDGRVAIARGPFDATMAVQEAGIRMAPVESSVDEPFARRVGFLGRGRVDASALDDETLLHVDGSPQLAGAVLDAVQQPEAIREYALAALDLGAHAGAPLIVCAPHPLGLPPETGIGLLLAHEQTLIVSVRPVEGALRISADMNGEFPPGAEANLRAFARSVAETDLGAALGLRDALPSLRIQAEEDHVGASATVDPAVLATGLRALLVAEIEELVEGFPDGDAP